MVIARIYPTIGLLSTSTPQARIKRKPSNSASIRKMRFRSRRGGIATHPPSQHDYISDNKLAPRWRTPDSNQGVNSISFGMLGMTPQTLWKRKNCGIALSGNLLSLNRKQLWGRQRFLPLVPLRTRDLYASLLEKGRHNGEHVFSQDRPHKGFQRLRNR
ncbi:uncharacterized protein TNIN_20111 [Trichonephila inaurata madagascariensis]|uniref:Uncharacterized protein n=1 Tax=Trichonephila inaurata madagascariensis TaxID=2747483 RepID=A0A8X6YKA3_9ARAC|nr:uncharacterized protein TNIN_20111 [Trichonephila inaurata madagascariensis]